MNFEPGQTRDKKLAIDPGNPPAREPGARKGSCGAKPGPRLLAMICAAICGAHEKPTRWVHFAGKGNV